MAGLILDESIYKVVALRGYDRNRPIPDQPADRMTPAFIHACDFYTVDEIVVKFYNGDFKSVVVVELDREKLTQAGFNPIWESNRAGGKQYWHLYRKTPGMLIPSDCIIREWHKCDMA